MRGNRREAIYEDDADGQRFLSVLAEGVPRYNWICLAYCLMTNHYHLVVRAVEGNFSQGVRHLNGVYTEASNRRHRRSGHLFQGRFEGILVDKDAYLLELTRYVVLNPVRAGLVESPEQWPWSSYGAMIRSAPSPNWLAVDALLSQFGASREQARRNYRAFVSEGVGRTTWPQLRQQIYPGDEGFATRMQRKAEIAGDRLSVPQAQRRAPAAPLAQIAARAAGRNAAIVAAYATGAYSYREIAAYFGLHLANVGRIVRAAVQQCEH